ncbi:MFS transporter [Chloroflexota bacterium]
MNEEQQPRNSAKGKLLKDRNLQVVFSVTLMAVLGVASITPVFPQIMHQFGITGARVGMLITFFTLPGVILAPFFGIMADRFGRKKILVPSLFLFAIAGTACAFTSDFNLLLGLRALQGIGGASLGSMNITIVGDLYAGRQRTEAMGLNASILSIGTAAYPTVGGALAVLGWNYPFILPVLAISVGIAVLAFLKNPEPRSQQSLKNYLGNTWAYLKNIRVVGLFLVGILTFVILYGAYLTYFTLLLSESFNASGFIIGLLMSGMSLTTALVSSQLGRINRRLSLGNIIKLAFIAYTLALVLIPFMPNIWFMVIPVAIFGIAHGANIPSIQTAVAGLAPLEYRAGFMSVNSTMLRLGQTIGPPLVAVIYVYGGLDAAFFVTAAIAALVPLVGIIFNVMKTRSGS